MKTSVHGLNLIKSMEGFRRYPYRCPAGVPTIGYGSTRYANGSAVKLSDKPISEAEATALLAVTLGLYEDAVTHSVKRQLDQNQFDAMVSLCYNIGPGNFRGSSVARLHKNGQYTAAATAFLLWNKAGGKILQGLVKRRKAERNLYLGEANV